MHQIFSSGDLLWENAPDLGMHQHIYSGRTIHQIYIPAGQSTRYIPAGQYTRSIPLEYCTRSNPVGQCIRSIPAIQCTVTVSELLQQNNAPELYIPAGQCRTLQHYVPPTSSRNRFYTMHGVIDLRI